ncbi:MAG TPA: polyphosphate kinase 2 family protein [Acidimicrobiales bacterium]
MIAEVLVKPGTDARLDQRPTAAKLGLVDKAQAASKLASLHTRLFELQARLWAEERRALLVVLQAIDAGGKDGTTRSVFSGVNPQGVRVVSFKVPAGRETRQDYLWRVHANCPGHGEIGIFNRSHYEDVVAVRVHDLVPEKQWRRRYRHIEEFERLLSDEGTRIVKIFLHISREEQRQRLQARIDDPKKNWKFRAGDLDDRARWDDLMAAYEDALTKTSTEWAPWYVIPADRKWVRNVAVSTLLVETLEAMDPQYPPPEPGIESIKVI